MPSPFALGYDPSRAAAAKAALLASGRYATVAPGQTVPPAHSLVRYRLRHLEQGQAGTCWAHAATALAEYTANARGYEAFPVCRRLVAWQGKQYEGGGNPSDGGSGIDALTAMTDGKGAGIAHESLCPYSDSRRTLGTKPPQNVFDDAKKCHLAVPVVVNNLDEAETLVAADTPVCLGIWWPYGWDNQQTFMSSIGRGEFGHELLIAAYAKAGVIDQYEWLYLDNWHGKGLYPSIDEAAAAKIPGHSEGGPRTSGFWVRRDVLQAVINYGDADMCSAADLTGFSSNVVVPSDPDMFF